MKIGILGGGMMGLWLGYKLAKQGLDVHLIEKDQQLGGLATWFNYGEFIWDKFYHVILKQDTDLTDLIEELGLSSQLIWRETKTGFLWHHKFISMSNYKELLTFPALNVLDKIKLVAGLLRCQYLERSDRLHEVKATTWLTKVFGKKVYTQIWEPLLESKFGSLKSKIPASILYSTIMRYRSTRNNSSGKEQLGCLQGGQKTIIDKLHDEIIRLGGKISCKCEVIKVDTSRPIVVQTHKEKWEFDRLINTLPSGFFNALIGEKSTDPKPHFLGVICFSAVLKQSFSPYYVTNLIDKGFPFTGIIEPSNVAGSNAMNGYHLLMLPRYDTPESPWFLKNDTEIKAQFLASLKTIAPDIEDKIVRTFVNRAKYVQAIWIDSPPPKKSPKRSADGAIFTINSELLEGNTLSNNSIISIAKLGMKEFLAGS